MSKSVTSRELIEIQNSSLYTELYYLFSYRSISLCSLSISQKNCNWRDVGVQSSDFPQNVAETGFCDRKHRKPANS